MKAATGCNFELMRKYERLGPRLLLVFVWNVRNPSKTSGYALTYQEAFKVAKEDRVGPRRRHGSEVVTARSVHHNETSSCSSLIAWVPAIGRRKLRRSVSFNGHLPTVRRLEPGHGLARLTPQSGPRQLLLSQTGAGERLEGSAALARHGWRRIRI